ncbi:MAG: hypothetical protein ACOYYU_06165 [Chloroflexota bacterium]
MEGIKGTNFEIGTGDGPLTIANCQSAGEHLDKKLHQQMNLLLNRLDEQQRRWYVATEASQIGHGGIQLMSQITGRDEKTIQHGQQALEQDFAQRLS